MAATLSVPVEEYLRTTYHPDMEYVDGELVERHVGEHKHSRLQALMVLELGPRERARRFRVLTEQRLRVLGTKNRFRIPDVCVMALPYHAEPVLATPPHLIVEIRSPEDETADVLAKLADYLRFGVAHIWMAIHISTPCRRLTAKVSDIAPIWRRRPNWLAAWISTTSSPGWMSPRINGIYRPNLR